MITTFQCPHCGHNSISHNDWAQLVGQKIAWQCDQCLRHGDHLIVTWVESNELYQKQHRTGARMQTTDSMTTPARDPGTVPALVLFSESFTGTAKNKLEFLQGMGGRVVALTLEDCDGMTAQIDRWGKVTWADKPTWIERDINSKIPMTADGQIIYPDMPVFLCSPYSTEKAIPMKIRYVVAGGYCALYENMYYNGEYMEVGNMERCSKLYSDEDTCLKQAHAKYSEYIAEQKQKTPKQKEKANE